MPRLMDALINCCPVVGFCLQRSVRCTYAQRQSGCVDVTTGFSESAHVNWLLERRLGELICTLEVRGEFSERW